MKSLQKRERKHETLNTIALVFIVAVNQYNLTPAGKNLLSIDLVI